VTTAENRRRALIVSHVFPPQVAGGAPRMGQFARLLPEHGWDVTVLTSQLSGITVDRSAEDAVAARARIIRAWSPISSIVKRGTPVAKHGIAGTMRRLMRTAAAAVLFPDRQVLWVPPAVDAGRRVLRDVKHDAVVATYGPASNLVVGHVLARSFKLPLLVDFRDLWSTLPMPIFPSTWHRNAAHKLEHHVLQHASRLIAVSPAMASDLAVAHGLAAQDAITITNGFDPLDVARVRDARIGEARPFRLMYTGTIHAYYDLEPFWIALRALRDAQVITPQTFRVEFVGNLSPDEPKRYQVEDLVELTGFVPHDKIFDAFARADALLLLETPGYYARYSYAAKVFDYVLTGKPIVSLVETGGNTARLLAEGGVGYFADPSDIAGIRRVLEQVLRMKGAPPRRMNPEEAPLRDFDRDRLVGLLASTLDAVVAEEPHGRWPMRDQD
jgi:glycosyltransferase involved in cell wall biosynthesis